MDAVRTTLQTLGGTMQLTTSSGAGTCFTLKLPLTIAIINVLLVTVGPLTLAVPVTNVLRTMEIKRAMVTVRDNDPVFLLGEETVQLASFGQLVGKPASLDREIMPLFICELKGRKIGFVVDSLLGHQEVYVKPLGRPLTALKGLNGGTILGGGEIVFILDISSLC
jgi:two-component system chemotaxis sensor kinase CheA